MGQACRRSTVLLLALLPAIHSFCPALPLAPPRSCAALHSRPQPLDGALYGGVQTVIAQQRRALLRPLRMQQASAAGPLPSFREGEGRGVVVYSTPGCKFCARAKARLRELGAPYTDVDVGADAGLRKDVGERSGGKSSVPQIFIDGKHVGGCDDMMAEDASGALAARFAAAGIALIPPEAGVEADGGAGVGIELGPKDSILNFHDAPQGGALPVDELARQLQSKVLQMYDEFLTPDGKAVNFDKMRGSKAFADYVRQTASLREPSITGQLLEMGHAERQALFINVYNSLILHATIALEGRGPSSPDHRGPFFSGESGARYNIGGTAFSLDDIEHGILRGSPKGDKRSFTPEDPRLRLAAKGTEPRLHFALNCGARSCPPIKLYTGENLEEGLTAAAEAFLESECTVDLTARKVTLSRILMWYGVDFGDGEEAVLRRVCGFMKEGSAGRRDLEALLSGGEYEVVYSEYDWSTNSA